MGVSLKCTGRPFASGKSFRRSFHSIIFFFNFHYQPRNHEIRNLYGKNKFLMLFTRSFIISRKFIGFADQTDEKVSDKGRCTDADPPRGWHGVRGHKGGR